MFGRLRNVSGRFYVQRFHRKYCQFPCVWEQVDKKSTDVQAAVERPVWQPTLGLYETNAGIVLDGKAEDRLERIKKRAVVGAHARSARTVRRSQRTAKSRQMSLLSRSPQQMKQQGLELPLQPGLREQQQPPSHLGPLEEQQLESPPQSGPRDEEQLGPPPLPFPWGERQLEPSQPGAKRATTEGTDKLITDHSSESVDGCGDLQISGRIGACVEQSHGQYCKLSCARNEEGAATTGRPSRRCRTDRRAANSGSVHGESGLDGLMVTGRQVTVKRCAPIPTAVRGRLWRVMCGVLKTLVDLRTVDGSLQTCP